MNYHHLHMDDHDIDYAKQDEAVQNLLKWFLDEGGYIHPQVQIRRWDPEDPSSYFGAFVHGPVKEDELLMKIPGSIKIQLDPSYRTDKYTYVQAVCELSWMLHKEYQLGKDSKYAPYIDYIKTQSKHQIPAMWSDVGKYLITKVQGDLSMMDYAAEDTEGEHMHNWIDDYFTDDCLEESDDEDNLPEWFVAMTTQRGFDSAIIPVYDMLNHHNGHVTTETRPSIFDEDGFGVYALQDMDEGDELLFSYHDCPDCRSCPDCETSLDYWGTPEMLRDFGFVEPYPQRFYYQDMGPVYLEIEYTDDRGFTINNVGGKWPDIEWVEEQIERLGSMIQEDIYPLRNALPLHELETIANYHEALSRMFTIYYRAHMEDNLSGDEDDENEIIMSENYNDSESEDEDENDETDADDECSSHYSEEQAREERLFKKQQMDLEEEEDTDEEEDVDDFSTEL